MKIGDMISDGMNELLSDLSNSAGVHPVFTWQTVDISCVPSTAEAGAQIVIGGIEATLSCVLHVLVKNFLTADSTLVTVDSEQFTTDAGAATPVVGKLVIFRQKSLRILASSLDASGVYLRLTLGNPSQ